MTDSHCVSREAEPVESEIPLREEEEEEDVLEEETPMLSEEGESPMFYMPEEGSGGYEGSAADIIPMADQAFEAAESETGSGQSWTEKDMKLGNCLAGNVLICMYSVVF